MDNPPRKVYRESGPDNAPITLGQGHSGSLRDSPYSAASSPAALRAVTAGYTPRQSLISIARSRPDRQYQIQQPDHQRNVSSLAYEASFLFILPYRRFARTDR